VKKLTILLLAIININYVVAQILNLPINSNTTFIYENNIYDSDTIYHTAIKPLILSELGNRKKQLLNYKNGENRFINIKPIIKAVLGSDSIGFVYNTAIGAELNTVLGEKMALNFNISQNRNKYTRFQENKITEVSIPHFGKYYIENGTYNFTDITGYISYSPSKYFNFQFGKSKNFFGDGYRSILLSDNSNSNWQLKGTVNIWKVKYVVIYNYFKDVDCNANNLLLNDKYSTVHLLSWNINKRINFNLFEAVIWHGKDSMGYRGFDVNYLNPIVFYRPIEFSLGSPDNVIMGGGYKLKIAKSNNFYGQIILDEFKLSELKAQTGWWANKFGYQIGFKTYNFANIKKLYMLVEYNRVRPFTYSHTSSLENWGNYYQSMAHPLGSNFDEFVAILKYPKNKWLITTKINISRHGIDVTSVNYGGNIYKSYNDNVNIYGNTQNQGYLVTLKQAKIKATYFIKKEWDLALNFGVIYRNTNNISDLYYFAGVTTNIFNNEIDF